MRVWSVCLVLPLGVAAVVLTAPTSASAQSTDWTFCASEGGSCSFSGTTQVRYGANGVYVYGTFTNGTPCTNAVFGDPAPGVAKSCAVTSSEWTFCASEGNLCAFSGTRDVRYGASGLYVYKTATDGIACSNSVFGDPAPNLPKQCAMSVRLSQTLVSTTSSSAYGPKATITCPAGAIDIWPGQYIQGTVDLYPATTTFCLRAGVHNLTSAITPKTGNTFVGEYGAILDGANWTTTNSTQAAFRAHNQDIDYVTIRNLVIRNMPQKGIQAYYWMADHWTIEFNEIAGNKTGIVFPNNSMVRNNYIHHNYGDPSSADASLRGGGYVGYYATNTTFDSNEIAYNGKEQKVMESVAVTFRNNFVHHNQADGIWYDGGNPNAVIEGNRVEDNARNGIFYEASNGSVIRNNSIRRNGDTGVFISTSQNAQIYGNTLEDNFRAITYFIDCGAAADPTRTLDLANNAAHDNSIRVGVQAGAFASGFSYTASCTQTQVAGYTNGSKNLTFSHNTYYVPSLSGWYWFWAQWTQWWQWQAAGNDVDGIVTQ